MTFIHQTWKDVRHDIRNVRWNGVLLGKLLLPFLILCWVFVLVATPIAIMVGLARRTWAVACTPDDRFNLTPERFSYWSRTGFFQITLAFGNLTFDQAKLIDVIWDVVVGRGGQVLIALCSWHVFSLYVTTSMETTPITYHSYRAVFLETGPSCMSTLLLARDFLWRKGLHSKIAMLFMILIMVFALCFPTFASAMTGYTSTVTSYVPENSTGHLISFDKFVRVLYVVHDGDRIGKTNPYFVSDLGRQFGQSEPIVSNSKNQLFCAGLRHASELIGETPVDSNTTIDWRNLTECDMQYYISKYVKQYGFNRSSNEASTFAGLKLEPPTLRITAEHFYDSTLFGSATSLEIQDQNKTVWMWANQTYTYEYLSLHGECQSSGTTYQWGFSFMLLFSMVLMLLLWTFGIITMWWHAQMTMQKRGQYFVAGTHKAVIELAAAMSKEFDLDVLDCKLLSEKQVQERIAAVQGGCISYTSPLLVERELPDTSLRKWLLQNTWWFLSACALAIITSVMWYSDILFCFWMIGPTLGMMVALSIGTTLKSRCVFIIACTIVSSVPVVYIAMAMYRYECLKPFSGSYQFYNVFAYTREYGYYCY